MRIVRQSLQEQPQISLILLDWGVRESFHLLHYLGNQTLPRKDFEVIVIEYYSTVGEPLRKFEAEVDALVLLEMPYDCYYHKHLMYNVGIALSKGEILMFADSDAMVRPTFLETAVSAFRRDPLLIHHMDEFRNIRQDLYPFNYPTFEQVLGDGCINNVGGKTKGVLDKIDPIHTRNYGACMSAKRADVIAIGGADEDLTYLGHICGPYDMTFRLMHFGRRLHWETEEYLYHTWHPGTDGAQNHLGPHDGRNMSTTAFQALCSGRTQPLVENEAIRRLRTGTARDGDEDLQRLLINADYTKEFSRARLGSVAKPGTQASIAPNGRFCSYRGFDLYRVGDSFYGVPQGSGLVDPTRTEWRADDRAIVGHGFDEIQAIIDEADDVERLETVGVCNVCRIGQRFAAVPIDIGIVDFHIPSHRNNPRIVWTRSWEDARDAASKIELELQTVSHLQVNGVAASKYSDSSDQIREFLAPIEARIAGLDRSIAGLIGESRSVREQLAQPDEQLAELNIRIAAIKSDLDNIRGNLIERDSRVAELNSWTARIESDLRTTRENLMRQGGQTNQLSRELSAMESGLRAIYQSRTWRTLIRIGALLLRGTPHSRPSKPEVA